MPPPPPPQDDDIDSDDEFGSLMKFGTQLLFLHILTQYQEI